MGEQKFLFGDADKVYNTLSTEATIIKEEMKAVQKRINGAETVLAILNNRKNEVENAMELLLKKDKKKKDEKPAKKVAPEKKKSAKKKKEEKKK